MIENLVFKGCGMKGVVYAGTKRLAGTSAGALTAAVLAVGGGTDGLFDAAVSTDFSLFISDKGSIFGDLTRFIKYYGVRTGDGFTEAIKAQIQKAGCDVHITFQELYEQSQSNPAVFKELFIVASNLSRQTPIIFNKETFPDLPIWKALRASVSIPFLFMPYEIDGEYYVDGGICWNYPIDLFEKIHQADPADTLGFYLASQESYQTKEWEISNGKIDSLKTYCSAMASFMMDASNNLHINALDLKRTVFINDLGVSGTNFKTPKSDILKLIESGKEAAGDFLQKSIV